MSKPVLGLLNILYVIADCTCIFCILFKDQSLVKMTSDFPERDLLKPDSKLIYTDHEMAEGNRRFKLWGLVIHSSSRSHHYCLLKDPNERDNW